MKTSVRISGFKELDRKLSRMARSLPERTQKRILAEAGDIIADEARQLVPVRTGDLRGSIVVSDERLGGAFKMDGGLSSDAVTVYIGPTKGGRPDGFHAHFVEFGTINMPAEPFMRPAFDNTEGQVHSRIRTEIMAEIDKAKR